MNNQSEYVPEEPVIYVAKPSVPPLDAFVALVNEIWDARILSNYGAMARRFERALAERLEVEHLSLIANGMIGAVVALRQLGVRGEVITTPFTFVATANAIRHAGAEPVFADIDPETLNIDPEQVERRITPRTSAIFAVHCYGVPCDVDALADIGARHGIPVIYDAAHAFGVRRGGESLLRHGDMSVLSMHATKVFHCAEGGAVICRDAQTKRAIDILCNHGIASETSTPVAGLNAKMSELHAALGLAQLGRVDADIAARKALALRYEAALSGLDGLRVLCPAEAPGHNQYAYPIVLGPAFPVSRDALHAGLKARGVVARRYFHPLVPHLEAYRAAAEARGDRFPVAERAAASVLCLPLYPELSFAEQDRVIEGVLAAGSGDSWRVAV
jgi:dTDP-4-amino-4,6-dideoxygalactose transaminase